LLCSEKSALLTFKECQQSRNLPKGVFCHRFFSVFFFLVYTHLNSVLLDPTQRQCNASPEPPALLSPFIP
jgi:hypothetical protein